MPQSPSTTRARSLRGEATRAEARLWAAVRNRQLAGFKFRRQLPVDRYFADFACPEARLVIELDGGQHAAAAAYDEGRTAVLEHAGYVVLRFWNNEVIEELDGVLFAIERALRLARP